MIQNQKSSPPPGAIFNICRFMIELGNSDKFHTKPDKNPSHPGDISCSVQKDMDPQQIVINILVSNGKLTKPLHRLLAPNNTEDIGLSK